MGRTGAGEDLPLKAEDLQIVARVYEAQRAPVYHKKAIATFEKLMTTGLATPDDRYVLARLYDDDGNWAKAREQYQAMTKQIGPGVAATCPIATSAISRPSRPSCSSMSSPPRIRGNWPRHRTGRSGQAPPAGVAGSPVARARVCKANNEISKAVELIESGVARPQLPPGELLKLAALAEEVGRPELAERLLGKLASQQDRFEYRLPLVRFLARTGRVEAALDRCEQLWKGMPNPDALVPSLLDVVLSDKSKNGPAQLERVAGGCSRASSGGPSPRS